MTRRALHTQTLAQMNRTDSTGCLVGLWFPKGWRGALWTVDTVCREPWDHIPCHSQCNTTQHAPPLYNQSSVWEGCSLLLFLATERSWRKRDGVVVCLLADVIMYTETVKDSVCDPRDLSLWCSYYCEPAGSKMAENQVTMGSDVSVTNVSSLHLCAFTHGFSFFLLPLPNEPLNLLSACKSNSLSMYSFHSELIKYSQIFCLCLGNLPSVFVKSFKPKFQNLILFSLS